MNTRNRVRNIAGWINSRNSSIFWGIRKKVLILFMDFIKKKFEEQAKELELNYWYERFDINKHEAAFEFWYEIHKGIHESFKGIIC